MGIGQGEVGGEGAWQGLTSEKSSETQRGMGVPQYLFREMAQSLASFNQLWKRRS